MVTRLQNPYLLGHMLRCGWSSDWCQCHSLLPRSPRSSPLKTCAPWMKSLAKRYNSHLRIYIVWKALKRKRRNSKSYRQIPIQPTNTSWMIRLLFLCFFLAVYVVFLPSNVKFTTPRGTRGGGEGVSWNPSPEFLICCRISKRFCLQWRAFDPLSKMRYILWVVALLEAAILDFTKN